MLGMAPVYSVAQTVYGNEWVNKGQKYYKIKIYKDGFYRLSYTDLASYGLNNQNPAETQIFFQGKQISIAVNHPGGGASFDPGDYIEFYGIKNTGALDSAFYSTPTDQPQRSISFYTDTSVYFLTWQSNSTYSRITEANGTSTAFTAPTDFTEVATTYPNQLWHDGKPVDPVTNYFMSEYWMGEGYMSFKITMNNGTNPPTPVSSVYSVTTPGYDSSQGKPLLEVPVYGESDQNDTGNDHGLYIEVKSKSASSYHEVFGSASKPFTYDGYKFIGPKIKLGYDDLQGDAIFVKIWSVQATSANIANSQAIAYARVTYPRSFNSIVVEPYAFKYTNTSSDKITLFTFTKFKTTKKYYLYDIENSTRVEGFISGTTVNFNAPNTGNQTHYYFYDTLVIGDASISGLFTYNNSDPLVNNFDPNNGANYIIITNKSLLASSKEYANYRKTTKYDSNTSYVPAIYTVDALYDMFYYGVQHHALALKNFIAWYYNNAPKKPKFLLFIGRGMAYNLLRSKGYWDKDLVPNIGSPASDLMYGSLIDNNTGTLDPMMGIGRLSCHTDDSVRSYLNKVKDYESQTSAPWKKNVIHVVGGEAAIIPLTKGEMEVLKDTVQNPYVGANVKTYVNDNQNAVNQSSADAISPWINQGASLLTYFGHGSGQLLGVPIGDPGVEIKNQHKYPVMYMNGCNLGNPTFDGNTFIAYQQIFTPNAGAIVWMSHSATTYTSALSTQMGYFYNNMCRWRYGKTVGEIWRYAQADFDSFKTGTDLYNKNVAYTLVFQGDPAIRFPYEPLPDYAIDATTGLSVYPSYAIASDPNITLRVHINNLGKYIPKDSFRIKVERKFPGSALADSFYYSPKYPGFAHDTFYDFVLKNQPGISQGNNNLCATVDYDNKVKEMDESNNNACLPFYLNGNGIRLLYPLEYSIVSTTQPELVVQNRNLFGFSTPTLFEIDTNRNFKSPRKMLGSATGQAIMKYKPNVDLLKYFGKTDNDTLVIYWRAKLNITKGDGDAWDSRSFTYMPKSPSGWSQSHWQQYKSITGNNVNWDTLGKLFEFQNTYVKVTLNTHPYYHTNVGITTTGLPQTAGVCATATMVLIQYDKITMDDKDEYATMLDCNKIPTHRAYKMFNMLIATTDPTYPNVGGRAEFNTFVRGVPDGDYLALITRGTVERYSAFDTATLTTFKKYMGTSLISKLASSTANDSFTMYGLLSRKNANGGVVMAEGSKSLTGTEAKKYSNSVPPNADILTVVGYMSSPKTRGSITSTVVGPASKWYGAYQKIKHLEKPDLDSQYTHIFGLDSNQNVVKELGGFNTYSLSLTDSTIYNPRLYPYLQLVTELKDTMNHTPAQMKIWTVLYDGIPEGTLAMDTSFHFSKIAMKEGDSLRIRNLRFVNISKYPFRNPIPVKYAIVDINSRPRDAWYYYYTRTLQPDSSFKINTSRTTVGLDGDNVVSVFVNPHNQPEITLDNNIISQKFNVLADKLNPILDVTFDGKHILDGEIISAKPVILITNKDENKSRLIVDTALMKIALKGPNDAAPQPVSYLTGQLVFYPGTLANNNKARVEFRPQNLSDGTYELHVQAYDASKNKSGNNEYIITFQIINKAMVSNVFVYPNPFTTKARFVFTLTGSSVPDYMKIQIMTITGRVVKEIKKEDLGPLHIGNNITQYAWDGTDEFGGILANGLYMYRVVTKDAMGKEFDNYSTSADQYFKNNFGKLVILR